MNSTATEPMGELQTVPSLYLTEKKPRERDSNEEAKEEDRTISRKRSKSKGGGLKKKDKTSFISMPLPIAKSEPPTDDETAGQDYAPLDPGSEPEEPVPAKKMKIEKVGNIEVNERDDDSNDKEVDSKRPRGRPRKDSSSSGSPRNRTVSLASLALPIVSLKRLTKEVTDAALSGFLRVIIKESDKAAKPAPKPKPGPKSKRKRVDSDTETSPANWLVTRPGLTGTGLKPPSGRVATLKDFSPSSPSKSPLPPISPLNSARATPSRLSKIAQGDDSNDGKACSPLEKIREYDNLMKKYLSAVLDKNLMSKKYMECKEAQKALEIKLNERNKELEMAKRKISTLQAEINRTNNTLEYLSTPNQIEDKIADEVTDKEEWEEILEEGPGVVNEITGTLEEINACGAPGEENYHPEGGFQSMGGEGGQAIEGMMDIAYAQGDHGELNALLLSNVVEQKGVEIQSEQAYGHKKIIYQTIDHDKNFVLQSDSQAFIEEDEGTSGGAPRVNIINDEGHIVSTPGSDTTALAEEIGFIDSSAFAELESLGYSIDKLIFLYAIASPTKA